MPWGSQRRQNEAMRRDRSTMFAKPKCGWPLKNPGPLKRCRNEAQYVTPIAEIPVCGMHRQPGSDSIAERRAGL